MSEGAEPLDGFGGVGFEDISGDGQRFLIIREGAQTDDSSVPLAQLTVVLNWFEELKRLVPTP